MNSYFLLWYYTKGLSAALSAYGNLLRYVLHRYSVFGLLRTFFAPWKRDVSPKDWRGFRPWKSLERLAENFFARFMGMVVRSIMLLVGFSLLLLSVLGGGILFLCYLFSAVLIVLGVGLFLSFPLLGVGLFMAGILGGLVAFVGYIFRYQEESETIDVTILRKKRFFRKIIARLGLQPKALSKEVWKADTAQFLQFLAPLGIDEALYTETVLLEQQMAQRRDARRRFWTWENLQKMPPIGKGWEYAYTPHLDRFCLDLSSSDHTEYGKAELIGRKEEFKVAQVVLERANQNSVVLVGESGIGKKTFVHYLARLIRENAFQGSSLGNARVLQFDVALAVSAAMSEGQEVDGYIRGLLEEAAYAGNVLLFIENIDLFLGVHKGGRNLGPIFSEFLALPSFRMIATATPHSYHSLAQEDEQILKFLESIYLRETDEAETLLVLMQHFEHLEKRRVLFSMKGFKAILASAEKIHWETPFPERALDLAEEVLVYWKTTQEPLITEKVVNDFVTLKTGVPVGRISEAEKEKLLKLEELLHERVIGQDEAVKQVAEAMRKSRAGFGNAKRPLGSFIFLGPTGVGKTETVKAFAESYFGSEEKMIRLDMSEYQTPEALVRLLGSQDTPGQLVSAVKETPFSILLLDEIEKAYPKVLDIFLQILDEGYVTDGAGEKANFRNMIIVATSNAGSTLIRSSMAEGKSLEETRKAVLDHIVNSNIFRLEFLNRFDGIIFFKPLLHEEMLTVTRLKLEAFAQRLKKEKNITILFDADVAAKIVEKGYEPEFGARSINRYIEDTIEDAVVKQVIAGKVSEGGVLSVTAAQL